LKTALNIKEKQKHLKAKYKQLLENAYNHRQIDSAMSDFFEFKAIQLLNEINQLDYLSRDSSLKI
jgi:hypothetical protein